MKLLIPILLLCLTALAQPPMPVVKQSLTPHKPPLLTPKASTIQTATIMRKVAAVSLPTTFTNAVSIGGLIMYDSYACVLERSATPNGPWDDVIVWSNLTTPSSYADTNCPYNPAYYRLASMTFVPNVVGKTNSP